jgi:hypothetical protein
VGRRSADDAAGGGSGAVPAFFRRANENKLTAAMTVAAPARDVHLSSGRDSEAAATVAATGGGQAAAGTLTFPIGSG